MATSAHSGGGSGHGHDCQRYDTYVSWQTLFLGQKLRNVTCEHGRWYAGDGLSNRRGGTLETECQIEGEGDPIAKFGFFSRPEPA